MYRYANNEPMSKEISIFIIVVYQSFYLCQIFSLPYLSFVQVAFICCFQSTSALSY